jgi:mannose-1-phosphate guanylyltransferase
MEHYYAVIMAGGGGTRLWPLSRQARPKQMLSLFDDRTLFQSAVDRLDGVFADDQIFVVTVAEQAVELQAQCPQIPKENFINEPMPRGTASVVGLAAVALEKRDPEAVMAVLTADHHIGSEDNFRKLLRSAYQVAQNGYLVTLGISPTYPATGYGYIQRGERLDEYTEAEVYRVRRFKEKPDEDQAQQMLESGDHSWNSGMFVWRLDRIKQEFEAQMPQLNQSLQQLADAWGTESYADVLGKVWPELKSETIDYGVMEGAEQTAVIPASGLMWSDVGSWDSLFGVLPSDDNGNIVRGASHIGIDSSGSLIHGNQDGRLIVTIGVSGLVVVDTGDALLICPKEKAQQVKEVVSMLKKNNPDYL